MRGIDCTALWIKALYKCNPVTIYHVFNPMHSFTLTHSHFDCQTTALNARSDAP